jgi:hypothetical protein
MAKSESIKMILITRLTCEVIGKQAGLPFIGEPPKYEVVNILGSTKSLTDVKIIRLDGLKICKNKPTGRFGPLVRGPLHR